jgi:hypothetical protein
MAEDAKKTRLLYIFFPWIRYNSSYFYNAAKIGSALQGSRIYYC